MLAVSMIAVVLTHFFLHAFPFSRMNQCLERAIVSNSLSLSLFRSFSLSLFLALTRNHTFHLAFSAVLIHSFLFYSFKNDLAERNKKKIECTTTYLCSQHHDRTKRKKNSACTINGMVINISDRHV